MEEIIRFNNSNNYFTFISNNNDISPLVIIVPGGGYHHTSKREAFNVASYFLNLGFKCAVLNYREQIDIYPEPQKELGEMIDYFRNNQNKYDLNGKILGIGFSAGAHLLLSETNYYNEFQQCKPVDGVIACYPVVSSDFSFGHLRSFATLLNGFDSNNPMITNEEAIELLNSFKENNDPRYPLIDKLSIEKHLRNDFPEIFIWHTFTDESVNVLNSLKLIEACKKNNINVEAHVFPRGAHGMSLCDDSMTQGGTNHKDDYVAHWTSMLKDYLVLKGWIK
ncbi:MAG: alpha/beta hydrolase [Acholeplasmatales bacterium]|nr:alpha/beta hydrolase [Acholeplasmatales bacterium]